MKTFKQFLSEAENAGYHYGDLQYGRDTALGRMSGRSTGHFGTGVYFLSQPMSNTGRDDRPVKKVDLSKYHLAKPRGKSGAKQLHDALKKINSLLHNEDKDEEPRLIRKAAFELWLALMPANEDKIIDIIKKSLEVVRAKYDVVSHTSEYAESCSTLVMKELGYDGVDVRGIDGFDNTDYGTVIYARELSQDDLTEAKFDKNVDVEEHGDGYYTFTVNGKFYLCSFSPEENVSKYGPNFSFGLYDEKAEGSDISVTGTGNEYEVFSTVVKILRDWMELKKADFHFTAAKDEPSRVKLYDRMVKRLKLVDGWNVERVVGVVDIIYHFTKTNK